MQSRVKFCAVGFVLILEKKYYDGHNRFFFFFILLSAVEKLYNTWFNDFGTDFRLTDDQWLLTYIT